MLFLILMAVMSTGSAEVIAVSSIVIYDVYQTYLWPFRPNLKVRLTVNLLLESYQEMLVANLFLEYWTCSFPSLEIEMQGN